MATETTRPVLRVDIKRPQRADARRNFDALLSAAREAFAEKGVDASLEDIARRAGVGIGTLYRNFPTRQDLLSAVYFGEIEELCLAAEEAADLPPWEALTTWLRRFVAYVATKRAIWESLNRESDSFQEAREAMYAAGTPLFERVQAAGEARADMSIDDLLRMVSGLTGCNFVDEEQRDRVLQIALDGVRAR
ncbi:TetR/AcrR family transcriptional regulator [Kribbella sandramycini]|uniref:AcrR family transcriptional regulator n=1 Tax=Kribbella sandramycini TaxID=60450 RepID=A0A7Y4L4G7_9ACTN|nr:TetR/AcrR family transcriptional regulator [Kribbella sandramycini]MBB6571583.1 AcrR family transcriptional regulator [Kribbella sandramycini]NOL44229.1 TetR/AcrR family transcriptional regulator [Kribbella sandramycini]